MTETESTASRFAVYLIPPYPIARAVAGIHQVLEKQFGLTAASRFQVHATIQGFFKKVDGPLDLLIERLDVVFAVQQPVPVHFCGLRRDPLGVSLDISRLEDGPNRELLGLYERVSRAIRPFIAPDSDFVTDPRHEFKAHITLAFRDFLPELQDEVLDYLQGAPLPTEPFTADTFHLLQFLSQDWAGAWDQTLTWRLLRSWRV